tara:strand:- start:23 stop:385 length:363 start_codon:yes stop_codon:yes gene_type:complete
MTNITSSTNLNLTASDNVNLSGGATFSVQHITGPGAINLTDTVTMMTTTGANAYTLADGTAEGQLKIIIMKVDGGNATVTPDNYINGTSILFNNVNDTIVLMWQSTGWVQLARQNATVQG